MAVLINVSVRCGSPALACRWQIGNDAHLHLYQLYEECLYSISNLYAHAYTLESRLIWRKQRLPAISRGDGS